MYSFLKAFLVLMKQKDSHHESLRKASSEAHISLWSFLSQKYCVVQVTVQKSDLETSN